MTTLYHISNDILNKKDELQQMLDDGIEPSLDQAIEILDLQSDLTEKLKGYAHIIHQKTTGIDVLDSEIKRLQAIKQKEQNRIEWLQRTMIYAMQTHNLEKIDDNILPIKLRHNAPSVIVYCEVKDLPDEFIRSKTTVEADKTALKQALKDGLKLDGVKLESKTTIEIG